MSLSNNPVALVQNPALGAQLLWKFSRGFSEESKGSPVPMISLFLVLPMLFHERTLEEIKSTYLSSGLSKLVTKLSKERERLVSVHDRALRMRELTMQSLATAVAAEILHVEYETGLVWSNEIAIPSPPGRLKQQVAGADKLGRWFARLPQGQVFALLQVVI